MSLGPLRRIVVDGRPYRWRFNEVLVVIPGGRSGPQLYVDWGWRDWLEPEGPGPEPHFVTPRFAAAAGWPSATRGRPLRLGSRDGRFHTADADA